MLNTPVPIEFLHELADAADNETMKHFRSGFSVDNKLEQGFDPVTVADRDAELAIRALINERYPDHGIIGEEHGRMNEDSENVWVLDPVDGTRAFITGIPLWGSLIGLRHKGKAQLGMLSQPYGRERYWGDTQTAWYKGPVGERQLKVRSCSDLSQAIMLTTTPTLFTESERPAYDNIERQVRLARYGTDCYGYAMVAAGCADCVIESGLQIYDIHALIPILEGAGALVTNWTGGNCENGGRVVVSGDPRLHDQLLKELSQVK
ncbi:histidinol-phosphatase [Rhodobacteraceae bacterium RKSG542]|uniref:histidinol-phosphatase n=1 Tax=Pseudovibrio flavus TaxID=2529854 RepID=UPI0012BD5BBD|nr:histidinol-phosphatase [Pseudovibrio flavus]MTI16535.1 histidinol-phosphatase [Pseudovibrio flavus]